MKISNNKILITGGGSGIGLGLAERFIRENNRVIICGRRHEALNEAALALPGLVTWQCDLAIETDRVALYNWISEAHPDLNVLVNNAGIQQFLKLSDKDFFQKAKDEIMINVEAPLHLLYMFLNLPTIDTILNVTSGLAFTPLTKAPVYSATKAFLHSFTISAQHQVKDRNIEIIEIIPPALNTDLGGIGVHDSAPPVSAFIDKIFNQLKEGKTSLTFGFSEAMLQAGPAELQAAFNRMNS